MINSRLGLFTAACSGSTLFSITLSRHPFSRGYGVILPSSLTGVFPLVLGFSPRLPVSVCGTGALILGSSFSRQREISSVRYLKFRSPSRLWICGGTCFTIPPPSHAWTHSTNGALCLSFCVPASLKRIKAVQESQPVVHHLRLLASA